ncbi:MAG: hypothetical protein Q9221_006594 [Calogaya cf. arnoldii]
MKVVPTHTLSTAPAADVLIVPGGMGLFNHNHNDNDEDTNTETFQKLVKFIKSRYASGLHSILSICNGASLLAAAGILDHKRATTNKKFWNQITTSLSTSSSIKWQPQARFVKDGNIWTSGGVSAGIDVTLAWIGDVFGEEVAEGIADGLEYRRHVDGEKDEFAVRFEVV